MRWDKLEPFLRVGLAAGLLPGCGESNGRAMDDGGLESGIGTGGVDTEASVSVSASGVDTESTSDSASGPSSVGDSEDDGPTKFDLGEAPDVELPVDEGCRKVDFLFVIDNSGSMQTHQANLVNNFDSFITGIQATLETVDEYQVGVVTTDAYSANVAGCTGLGGLVVRTGGTNSSNTQCGPYAAGQNFITEQDDLAQQFACAAQVGTAGDGCERPMQAMEVVVRKDLGGPGQCNEGFLRDDALLVIVLLTDEWDGPDDPEAPFCQPSPGTPQSWYDTVVTAKGGNPENVVVLSLIHWMGGPCPPSANYYDGVHLRDFTELFGDNGFLGGICGDFGPIFNEATAVISEACENFMPPG